MYRLKHKIAGVSIPRGIKMPWVSELILVPVVPERVLRLNISLVPTVPGKPTSCFITVPYRWEHFMNTMGSFKMQQGSNGILGSGLNSSLIKEVPLLLPGYPLAWIIIFPGFL